MSCKNCAGDRTDPKGNCFYCGSEGDKKAHLDYSNMNEYKYLRFVKNQALGMRDTYSQGYNQATALGFGAGDKSYEEA